MEAWNFQTSSTFGSHVPDGIKYRDQSIMTLFILFFSFLLSFNCPRHERRL